MVLLEIQNVTRRFGNFEAVHDVSLEVEAGKFFTLLGPSGCGKTTLLRMIAGFDAPRPDLVHQFINFMLEGRNAAELTNLTGSGSPNLDAMQYIRAGIVRNEGIFPGKQVLDKLEQLRDLDRRKRRLLSRLWTEIKLSP